MDHDDDGETSYNTFVDDVAFEPTYSQALLTAAGRSVATSVLTRLDVDLVTSCPTMLPLSQTATSGKTGIDISQGSVVEKRLRCDATF